MQPRSLSRRAFLDAATAGDLEGVEQWLRQPDGDVNATTGERWTALMYAIARGHVAIVERLLREPSVDLNATTLAGTSALVVALDHRNNKLAALLLRSGASRSTVRAGGLQPRARGDGLLSRSVRRMLSPAWSVVWSPGLHARFPASEREKCRLVVFANQLALRRPPRRVLLDPRRLAAAVFRWQGAGGVRWTFLPPPLVRHIIEFAAFLW